MDKKTTFKINHPEHGEMHANVIGGKIGTYGHQGESVDPGDAHGEHKGGISGDMQKQILSHASNLGVGDHRDKAPTLNLKKAENMKKSEREVAIAILNKVAELVKGNSAHIVEEGSKSLVSTNDAENTDADLLDPKSDKEKGFDKKKKKGDKESSAMGDGFDDSEEQSQDQNEGASDLDKAKIDDGQSVEKKKLAREFRNDREYDKKGSLKGTPAPIGDKLQAKADNKQAEMPKKLAASEKPLKSFILNRIAKSEK